LTPGQLKKARSSVSTITHMHVQCIQALHSSFSTNSLWQAYSCVICVRKVPAIPATMRENAVRPFMAEWPSKTKWPPAPHGFPPIHNLYTQPRSSETAPLPLLSSRINASAQSHRSHTRLPHALRTCVVSFERIFGYFLGVLAQQSTSYRS
jgi:hypothetical protein